VSLERPSYDDLAGLVLAQAATIKRLEGEVAELRVGVAELKRRLGQSSRNSSRPPSSDGFSKPAPKSLRRPSGRESDGFAWLQSDGLSWPHPSLVDVGLNVGW
jgi:transposase